MQRLLPTLLLLLALVAACPAHASSLDVYYIEYPPYYTTQYGRPAGILVDRTNDIFQRAGILPIYKPLPAKRALDILQENTPAASIGWFKTPEREALYTFSLPIYISKPQMLVANASLAPQLAHFSTLKDVLASGLFHVGIIDGHSEGAFVDTLLAQHKALVHAIVGDEQQLIRMVHHRRVDVILLPPEEAATLIDRAGLKIADFHMMPLTDIPQGNPRHLLFSKAVPLHIVDRINKAIEALPVN